MALVTLENKHLLENIAFKYKNKDYQFCTLKVTALEKPKLMATLLKLFDTLTQDDSHINLKYKMFENKIKELDTNKTQYNIEEMQEQFFRESHTELEKLGRIVAGTWTLTQTYNTEDIKRTFEISELEEIKNIFDNEMLNEKDILKIMISSYQDTAIYDLINTFIIEILKSTWVENGVTDDDGNIMDLILDSKSSIDYLIEDDLLLLSTLILKVIWINIKQSISNIKKSIDLILSDDTVEKKNHPQEMSVI